MYDALLHAGRRRYILVMCTMVLPHAGEAIPGGKLPNRCTQLWKLRRRHPYDMYDGCATDRGTKPFRNWIPMQLNPDLAARARRVLMQCAQTCSCAHMQLHQYATECTCDQVHIRVAIHATGSEFGCIWISAECKYRTHAIS